MAKLVDIDRDGPAMFKQITLDTFTTSQEQTFGTLMDLYSLDLKPYKYNILKFHRHVSKSNQIAVAASAGEEEEKKRGVV